MDINKKQLKYIFYPKAEKTSDFNAA